MNMNGELSNSPPATIADLKAHNHNLSKLISASSSGSSHLANPPGYRPAYGMSSTSPTSSSGLVTPSGSCTTPVTPMGNGFLFPPTAGAPPTGLAGLHGGIPGTLPGTSGNASTAGSYHGGGLAGLPGFPPPPPSHHSSPYLLPGGPQSNPMATTGELKQHADFLSRLLAATPSYFNEAAALGMVGAGGGSQPPPGFFSDWLRRLVSKPGPGGGSSSSSSGPVPIPPPSPSSKGNSGAPNRRSSNSSQKSNLSSSSKGGTNTNGSPPYDMYSSSGLHSHLPQAMSQSKPLTKPPQQQPEAAKRRKRVSRVTDHYPKKDADKYRKQSRSPSTSPLVNLSQQQSQSSHHHPMSSSLSTPSSSTATTTSAPSSSSAAAAAAAAAAASLNPFTHPFWLFPPFLPNPYLNPMNLNFGASPSSLAGGTQGRSALSPQPSSLSSALFGTGGTSSPGPASGLPHLPLPPSFLTPGLGLGGLDTNLLSALHARSSADNQPSASTSQYGQSSSYLSSLDLNSAKEAEQSKGATSKGKQSATPPKPKKAKRDPSMLSSVCGSNNQSQIGNSKKAFSSFSISRLTSPSPSPSSSSSTGSRGSSHKIYTGFPDRVTKSPPSTASTSKYAPGDHAKLFNETYGFGPGSLGLNAKFNPYSAMGGRGGEQLDLYHSYNNAYNNHAAAMMMLNKSKLLLSPPAGGSGSSEKLYDQLTSSMKDSGGKSSPTPSTSAAAAAAASSGNSNNGLCVDLRVSGRIWEKKGSCSSNSRNSSPLLDILAPPSSSASTTSPRSRTTPTTGNRSSPSKAVATQGSKTISAFHDPSELGTVKSSSLASASSSTTSSTVSLGMGDSSSSSKRKRRKVDPVQVPPVPAKEEVVDEDEDIETDRIIDDDDDFAEQDHGIIMNPRNIDYHHHHHEPLSLSTSSYLSTTYVLRHLKEIYNRVRKSTTNYCPSPCSSTSTLPLSPCKSLPISNTPISDETLALSTSIITGNVANTKNMTTESTTAATAICSSPSAVAVVASPVSKTAAAASAASSSSINTTCTTPTTANTSSTASSPNNMEHLHHHSSSPQPQPSNSKYTSQQQQQTAQLLNLSFSPNATATTLTGTSTTTSTNAVAEITSKSLSNTSGSSIEMESSRCSSGSKMTKPEPEEKAGSTSALNANAGSASVSYPLALALTKRDDETTDVAGAGEREKCDRKRDDNDDDPVNEKDGDDDEDADNQQWKQTINYSIAKTSSIKANDNEDRPSTSPSSSSPDDCTSSSSSDDMPTKPMSKKSKRKKRLKKQEKLRRKKLISSLEQDLEKDSRDVVGSASWPSTTKASTVPLSPSTKVQLKIPSLSFPKLNSQGSGSANAKFGAGAGESKGDKDSPVAAELDRVGVAVASNIFTDSLDTSGKELLITKLKNNNNTITGKSKVKKSKPTINRQSVKSPSSSNARTSSPKVNSADDEDMTNDDGSDNAGKRLTATITKKKKRNCASGSTFVYKSGISGFNESDGDNDDDDDEVEELHSI